eukprot:tig00001299_g8073.t1
MSEVHFIGSIVGASGFQSSGVFCEFKVEASPQWKLLEGLEKGQTQIDYPDEAQPAIWSHPIDIHYAAKSVAGWPKIRFQVWSEDIFGRNDLAGYGFCHLPASPGVFDLEVPCWRPVGSWSERFSAFFIGGNPQLKHEEYVTSGSDRFRLKTIATGTVHLKIGVLTKNFEKFGVQL